jgi:hypothetical protein
MKTKLAFQKSDRDFQVWEYQVGHGNLLVRSPKSGNETPPYTNLDLHFVGVEYMAVPRHLRGLQLVRPTPDEIRQVESEVGESVPPDHVMILGSGGKRFIVVAAGLEASENDWEIDESPLEFRAQFRGEP